MNRNNLSYFLLACCVLCLQRSAKAQSMQEILRKEMTLGHLRPSVIAGAGLVDTSLPLSITVKESAGGLRIQTTAFLLNIQKKPFACNLLNTITHQKWLLDSIQYSDLMDGQQNFISSIRSVERKVNTWSLKSQDDQFSLVIEVLASGIIHFSIVYGKGTAGALSTAQNIKCIFKGAGDFFGGGERFLSSRLNGRKFTNQPHDRAWIPDSLRNPEYLKTQEPTYLPIPFIFTPQGNGLYVDEVNTTTIDLIHSAQNRFSILVDGLHTDLFFFAAANPRLLLKDYTTIIGRSPLPPKWAFGVWVNLRKGRDSVLYLAHFLRNTQIPVDAIWLFDFDDPESNTGWTYWTNGYFGNLRYVTDSLHALDFKVLTYLRSFSNKRLSYYDFPNPIHDEAVSRHFIMMADEVDRANFSDFSSNDQINFYNPATEGWWKNILKRNLVTEDFDGWMEDFGDVSYVYNRPKAAYEPMRFHLDSPYDKLSNEQIANLYPLLYHKMTHELSAQLKPDNTAFSRSGSAGSAAYSSVIWGGDQVPSWDKLYGYPSAITAGISAGLSGYGVWAPDILGLSPSRELWMRWVQFGALTPIMRDHPWDYLPENIKLFSDSATIRFFKKYAILHHALAPYLYLAAQESSRSGTPVMRHLLLQFPKDTTTYTCEYEYMLGDALLVAPVIEEGATVRKVYLPEGQWRYYWSDKIYAGKTWVTVNAPIDQIPFFILQGSETPRILPDPAGLPK